MKDPSTNTSTSPAQKEPKKTWKTEVVLLFRIWWPVIILGVCLIVAGITKYIYPEKETYSVMIDLIKSVGIIMVVMYVIYTRLLAEETKNMVEITRRLYSSEEGSILAESIVSGGNYNELPEEIKAVIETIHLEDKKMSHHEFMKLMNETGLPAISLKIKSFCSRRIEVNEVRYRVRHTGSSEFREVTYNISPLGKIMPWDDKDYTLIISPEGEVEVILDSVKYIDGDEVKPANILINKLKLDRIRKPENNING